MKDVYYAGFESVVLINADIIIEGTGADEVVELFITDGDGNDKSLPEEMQYQRSDLQAGGLIENCCERRNVHFFNSLAFWSSNRRNALTSSASISDRSNRLSINADAEPSNTRSTMSPSIDCDT